MEIVIRLHRHTQGVVQVVGGGGRGGGGGVTYGERSGVARNQHSVGPINCRPRLHPTSRECVPDLYRSPM